MRGTVTVESYDRSMDVQDTLLSFPWDLSIDQGDETCTCGEPCDALRLEASYWTSDPFECRRCGAILSL